MSTPTETDMILMDQKEISCCEQEGEKDDTQMTCDALCSLGSTRPGERCESPTESNECTSEGRKAGKTCPKQLQLPMFLSKTYHMIDRCPSDIACWSESGENFVVKNVEKFATNVLPLYFKHSNFSSFARQLNFYGFRKLRTDPILTSDVDPQTACYVRFYHEKFQKDKPDLLHQIKRATKTDQQSKDDVDSLKLEVAKLKETLRMTTAENDRKIEQVSFESKSRLATMTVEYEKLAAMIHVIAAKLPAGNGVAPTAAVAAAGAPDLLQSLTQAAAVSLQNHMQPTQFESGSNGKRPAEQEDAADAPQATRPRNG